MAFGSFASELRFDGRDDFHVAERSLLASVGRRFGSTLTLKLDAGAILGGALQANGVRYDVDPGWTVSATLAKRWIGGSPNGWFLVTSLSVGVSSSNTEGPDGAAVPSSIPRRDTTLTAQDSRIGIVFGRTISGVFSPYLVGKAFGGPVFFRENGRDVTGTDLHHYSLGFGGSLSLGGWDFAYEGSFLGERSLAFSAGHSFDD